MRRFLQIMLTVVVVWVGVVIGIAWVRSLKPTPQKIQAYLEKTGDLSALDARSRAELIQRVAGDLNRLDYREQFGLRRGPTAFNEFFANLTPEERDRFLEQTLPRGYSQLMQAFNKMSPEQRKGIVERALSDLDAAAARDGNPADRALSNEQAEKMVSFGLDAFYSDASAETKMDLSPIVERFQQIMQGRQ